MKNKFRKEEHEGYDIGEYIQIHRHISDPENWFVTIRPLQMFGDKLCGIQCTEAEIARYLNLKLCKQSDFIKSLIKEVIPFT